MKFRLHFPVKCDIIIWKPHAQIKGVYKTGVGANKKTLK